MENFGICLLSVVPVRSEPSDKAEITTQLIFGDLVEILESGPGNKWLKIKIEADQYEGWIDHKQVHRISKGELFNLKESDKFKTTEFATRIETKEGIILIPAGSTIYSKGSNKYYFLSKSAENIKSFKVPTPSEIIPVAKSYLNTPYLWGGKTHFGIDCSGFTQQVFGICGFQLPRDAWQQEKTGKDISLKDAKPTDVAFFKNEKGKIIHVGIILENDEIIHASGKVRIDRLDEKGIYKTETNEYSHSLASIKRI